MNNVAVTNTRNFALVGHAGDGKTSLGEAILHRAGATSSLGRVDDGTSVLNCLAEERDGHTATTTSHLHAFDWSSHHFTLVDTPGDPNYQADAQIVIQALDGAILVISGVDGVSAGTEKMMRAAKSAGTSVIAFINGMDRDRANHARALASLDRLDVKPAVAAIPAGEGEKFTGVIDLVRMRLFLPDGSDREIPAEFIDEVESRKLELVEAVAECDDRLLERYLEEGELTDEEVCSGLVAGARSGAILPVLCGSATQEAGIELLLENTIDLLPSPDERGEWAACDDATATPDPSGPLAAVVFKTIIDRYAGTLSVLRIVSGTLETDAHILNATTGSKNRIGKILIPAGEKHTEVPSAGPGDIVAVAKVKDLHTGNVVTSEKGGIQLIGPTLPQGVLSYAISAKSQGDEDKVYSSLGRLVEEDPTLQLGRDASTGEFLLTGMGELHIRTTVKKLQRMFNVEVELRKPKVPYRETIKKSIVHVEGKLKKQSGGKGMYGVCYLDVEPLPMDSGIQFENKIVGGAIPRNLIPAVEKGVREACVHGPLAGFPVVDVKVRCVDGKHHSVDSNEMAFKLAGSFGFKAAMEKAAPTILEPIMKAEVSVPDECVGDIMGDISSRRGRVQTSENRGHETVVIVEVPMAEMLDYASTLTSLTGGKGSFHMEFAHYEETPANVREKIIADAEAAKAQHG